MSKHATISAFLSPHLSHDPELRHIVLHIHQMSVRARKAVLSICQAAFDLGDDQRVDEELEVLYEVFEGDREWSRRDVQRLVTRLRGDHTSRSFISMLLRNEPLPNDKDAIEVIESGFIKELLATQNRREERLEISYQCFDLDNFAPADYTIYYPISPAWIHKARGFIHRFAMKIDGLGIIFPSVQRRKNMSTQSCRNLIEMGYQADYWKDCRTLDLELFACQTGIRVEGSCEMRMAWKFNELKPRFYYCVGASSYWRSRYAKPLAVAMMECVQSTKQIRRSNPEDITYFLKSDDWLCIWDLYSFTSTLSELKHFLYYIIQSLKDDARVRQHPVRCLDYQLGVIDIPVYDILEQYNEGENYNNPFSILTALQQALKVSDEGDEFRTQNSGLLGVAGNIGFSTAFHGLHAEAGILENTGCGVGDDMLGGTDEDPEHRLIPHLRLIGDIHEGKATIFRPIQESDGPQLWKFLKRRFTRTFHGVDLDYLYSFPPLAEILGVTDDYHTILPKTRAEQIMSFAGQVGAMFWDMHHHGSLEEHEYQLLDRVLGQVYRKLKLSQSGSLPGVRHPDFADYIPVAIPPLHFDYGQYDWAEFLWDNATETHAVLPMSLGPLKIPGYIPGLLFNASEGSMLNVLEDVKCVEKLGMLTELVEVSNTNRRVFRSYLSGATRTFKCRYLDFVPIWFDDLYSDFSRARSTQWEFE